MTPARSIAHSEDRPVTPVALQAWEQLCKCFEKTVRESNVEAGEPLWTTASWQGPTPRVVVRSRNWPANYIELMFDPAQASVQCRFGPAIRRQDCEFELGSPCNAVRQRILSVLDALVFPAEN